jgi:predicted PurR-regulated permease PerM
MRRQIFFLASTLLGALVLYPLAFPLCLGLILGFLSENAVERLSAATTKHPSAGRPLVVSTIFVGSITCLILIPLVTTIVVSVLDITKLLADPSFAEKFSTDNFLFLRERLFRWISETLTEFGVNLSVADIGQRVGSGISEGATQLAAFLAARLAATPWFIFQILLAMVAWIYFAAHGREAREKALPYLIPWERERIIIRETVGRVIQSLFVASASIAFVQSVVVTVILGIASVPRFLMFGFLAFFVSFIPVVGTGIILIPSALYLVSERRWIAAALVASSSIGVGLIDNLLRPLLMREGLPLGVFWLFLAIIGGIAEFGIAGTVVGPIAFSLFAAARTILVEARDEALPNPIVSPEQASDRPATQPE